MDYAPSFARHFARLVWQLLNQSDAYEVQLASLQLLVGASRVGPVSVAVRAGGIAANGAAVADAGPEMQDFAAQLTAHSIAELSFEHNASPADLLLVARILAARATPGDEGRAVLARLRVLDARAVTVRFPSIGGVASAPAPNGAEPRAVADEATPDIAAFAPDTDVDDRGGDDQSVVPVARLDEMFEVFSSSEASGASPETLFRYLDGAATSKDAARELDALLKVMAEASARARHELVAELFHGIVTREAAVEDDAIRRQYGIALRRIAVAPILRSLALLLPRRRERHAAYMLVLARCEDAGAEALAESLIAAPSISDRRVYFDALVRLRSGIRTVVHMLGDSRWFVVRNAAELLGELKVVEAEPELMKLLEHVDDRVRSAAAGALARLGASRRGRGSRAAASVTGEHGAVAPSTSRGSNGHGGGSRSVHSLIKALDRESDTRVQVALIAALGQLGSAQAVEKLVEIARTERGLLARQRPAPLRVAAVHALGQAHAPNAQAALQALLRDKSPAIRGAASWVILGKREAASA